MRFVVLFLLLFACPQLVRGGGFAFTPEHYESEFLRAYLTGLTIIDSDLAMHYALNTREDRGEVLAEIHRLARRGSEMEPDADNALHWRLKEFLIPRLWQFEQMNLARGAQGEFREYYEERKTEFPTREWIRGARILVESGESARETVAELKRKLEQPGADFHEVARAYYHSLGEDNDGDIGRIQRGQVREALFNIFMEQNPDETVFGPVPDRHGYLLGKLYAKGPAGYLPFDEVKGELLHDFVSHYVERAGAELVRKALEEGTVELLGTPDRSAPPAGDTPAYRFRGEVRVYRDIQAALPGVFGDARSWGYFDAVRDMAVLNEVIRGSAEGKRIAESPAFRTLFAALIAYAEVAEELKAELAAVEAGATEEALREYYEERKHPHYRPAPEVRIVHVRVSRNPYGAADPTERREASRQAWETIQRIYEDFSRSESPRHFDFEDYRGIRGVRIRDASRWVSQDSLAPDIARRLREDPETSFSGFLIAPLEYSFYYLFERRHPLYPPFEEIRDRVRGDYLEAERRRVRERLLGG